MNKLILDIDGGFPLKTDDLDWLQKSVVEAISWLVEPYLNPGSQTLIISGLQWNNTDDAIEPGVIYHDGEMYYSPGLVVNKSTMVLWGKINKSLNPAGVKVFKDGNTHNTYEYQTVSLQYLPFGTPPLPDSFQIIQNRTLVSRTSVLLKEEVITGETLKSVTQQPGDFYPGTYILKGNISFSGFRCLTGRMYIEDQNEGDILHTLPQRYQPQSDLIVDVPELTNDKVNRIKIKTNGDIVLEKYLQGGDYSHIISMDGITYP